MSMDILSIISDPDAVFPEIDEEQALKAYMGALISIQDKYDALYFFACMNLLNAYVKKENAGEFKKDTSSKILSSEELNRWWGRRLMVLRSI